MEAQLKASARQAGALRSELQRLEGANNRLLGHGLEELDDSALASLTAQLNQARSFLKPHAATAHCQAWLLPDAQRDCLHASLPLT